MASPRKWQALIAVVCLSVLCVSSCVSSSAPLVAQPSRQRARAIGIHPQPAKAPLVPDASQDLLLLQSRSHPLSLTDLANAYIGNMTLDDELGQLFLADFTGDAYNASDAAMVEQLHAGGIILYARSIVTAPQTRALISAAQAGARIPLLVATDEEGGYVDRLQAIFGWRPSATQIGATGSLSIARDEGARAGRDMRSLGLNFDFGPDVDVQLVDGPDQSTRTFGSTRAIVSAFGGAYADGMQSAGVVVCIKHFPGLGAATSDAHLGLPVINRSRSQIESVELAPYRMLLATGQIGAVMTTDLLMRALDPHMPAELSPAIITGVLRDELGFDGVVVTDALYMDGIAARYEMPEAGVLAILAGDDLLVGPWTPGQMLAMMHALRDAIQSGRLTKARIDQSVRRILILKMRMGLIPVPAHQVMPVPPLGSMAPVAASG